ncbi:MAG: hypothetical protein CML37_01650 [Rhodobacteraceae bacterium]|nr:hypothetical protein [Paracoccaceae bacterium]
MQNFIENLRVLSQSIETAQQSKDYEKILRLDHQRKEVMDKIFATGIKRLSEENIKTIRSIAEANEKMIAEISIAGTKRAEKAHKTIKAIKGYHK